MTDTLYEMLKLQLLSFASIGLADMEGVALMNRVDTKFALPIELLPDLLTKLMPYYQILEVAGKRLSDYQTLYYDTPELTLYQQHHCGHLNRYKIRERQYGPTNSRFLEVKLKTNKGRTIKARIQRPGIIAPNSRLDYDPESLEFLINQLPFNPMRLEPVLTVDYSRMTLVSKDSPERLTLDIKLGFRRGCQRINYHRLVIAEVKQTSLRQSPFLDAMKLQPIRQGSLSKYCFGIISLFPWVRHNRFKAQFNQLSKYRTSLCFYSSN